MEKERRECAENYSTVCRKKPLMHIINCNTAREMWTKLCNVYQHDNDEHKYVLMQEFFSYKMNKSEDVSTHVSV